MKPKERNDKKNMSLNHRIIHLTWILLMLSPVIMTAQVTFSRIPMDKQLVARDTATNIGQVIVSGQVEYTGATPDYVKMRIEILREGSSYDVEDTSNLVYNNKKANFDFSLGIEAEFANYSIIIRGIKSDDSFDTITLPTGTGNDIVAGDVFMIQGQSNAEAWKRDPPNQSANTGNESQWIRTFGTSQRANNFLDNLRWEQANGDGPDYTFTVGQWGLKLGKLLIDDPDISVPIALFNGAQGNTSISQHLKDADPILASWDYNIYERLFIRLDSTHLRDKVRAIFWSQGENDGILGTSTQLYVDTFDELKDSWLIDFENAKKIYIFQTKSGCSQTSYVNEFETIKEAQRLIAAADNDIDIDIMQTALMETSSGIADYNCHFTFTNGYEEFAKRIFKLVDRDFYGGTYSKDIEPPMPLKAYLISPTSLVVETDASSLFLNNGTPELDDFVFNGGSAGINSVQPSGNKITIGFTGSINSSTTISYIGLATDENKTNFVVNSEGLELVCFDKFPIDDSLLTIWDGDWSPAAPVETMDARIDASSYSAAADGSIIARNLEISSGVTVNFDNNSNNNIILYGNLTLIGNLTIGDTESFLMKNTGATITNGNNFTKKERTTSLQSMYAVTYFSSPIDGASLSTVFDGVDPNRIFHYDPQTDNPIYSGVYTDYRHWHIASGSMIAGKGYAADGKLSASYPGYEMEVSFNGSPNYQDVDIQIGHGSNPSDPVDMTNLVGNPYPAAIDAELLIAANLNDFQGTLYLWGHGTPYTSGEYSEADYFAYNQMGSNYTSISTPYNIASGQGFMVMTDKPNRTFNFENSMMVEGKNDQFYKGNSLKKNPVTQKDRFWLKFSDDNRLNKEILIGLSTEASVGIDNAYDARLYTADTRISFYSNIADEKFSIQALNVFSKDFSVPLGFTTAEDGYFTIELSKSEGKFNTVPIFLYDRELDVLHDLIKERYMFQSQKGEFNDRFIIRFGINLDNVIENDQEKLMVDYLDNGFRLLATKKVLELRIYDVMGRLLYTFYPNETSFEIMLPGLKKGSLIFLQAMVDDGKVFSKKAAVL